jgi:hypothetical protein
MGDFMNSPSWHNIEDFYDISKSYKITHKKKPNNKFVRLSCVYLLKINQEVVHVGRSDTCRKHGGAEKVRKALVNLLNTTQYNSSVPKTKYWEKIRLKYRPNSSNIKIGIIETKNVEKIYTQESKKTNNII